MYRELKNIFKKSLAEKLRLKWQTSGIIKLENGRSVYSFLVLHPRWKKQYPFTDHGIKKGRMKKEQ